MTNHYELLYLVAPSYSEEEIEPIKEKVRDVITKFEGNITYEENFGKKKLAYPVNKNHQGYYLLTEFDLDGQNLVELNKGLKLTNELLRHIVVKRSLSKKPIKLNLSDDKPLTAPKSDVAPKVEETNTSEATVKPEDKKPAEKDSSDDSKIKLEDLDNKLDEILDGDIM